MKTGSIITRTTLKQANAIFLVSIRNVALIGDSLTKGCPGVSFSNILKEKFQTLRLLMSSNRARPFVCSFNY